MALSASISVAMEDRKRSFGQVELEVLQPSKKPLETLSDSGPLTQQDVVYFKKEAIWRQMRYYKLQVAELSRELSKYEKRYQSYVAVHLLLEAWYSQVLRVCGNLKPRLLDLAGGADEIEAILDERRDTLAKLLKPLVAEDVEADAKLLDVVTLEAEKQAAGQLKSTLEDQLLTLHTQIQALQKLEHRRESVTLKRILDSTQVKQEEPSTSSNGDKNGSLSDKSDAKTGLEASAAEKEELEKLKIEFEQLKAGYTSFETQFKVANTKLTEAERANTELEERLNSLTDADLAKCSRYVSLLDNNKLLTESIAQANKLKDELVEKLKELEERDGDLRKRVNKELEDENHQLKENLSKTESDLVRIRTARDELLGKQNILKQEIENKKTNEEVNKLNMVLNERLKTLEETRQNEHKGDDGADLELLDKEELVKRLQILSGEVKEIEQAFQDTRNLTMDKLKETVDYEGLVKKLSIEKSKADQKYFASMRLKDALVSENKILKTQVAKSQELVVKLNELEKNYLSKIDLLTKNVNDLRMIKEGSIHETSKLQENLKQLSKARELASREIHQLKSDVAELKKEKSDMSSELKTKRIAQDKLEAKLRATENLLLKYKLNNTSSILQEDEKQLEALRSITKCSVCSKNWKNTVITACGHVFCDGCVQERLAARLRRCPTCNKGFSSNDLLSIHL